LASETTEAKRQCFADLDLLDEVDAAAYSGIVAMGLRDFRAGVWDLLLVRP